MFNIFKNKYTEEAERVIQVAHVLSTRLIESLFNKYPDFKTAFKKEKLTLEKWIFSVTVACAGITFNSAPEVLPSDQVTPVLEAIRKELNRLDKKANKDLENFSIHFLMNSTEQDSKEVCRAIGEGVLLLLADVVLSNGGTYNSMYRNLKSTNVADAIGTPIFVEFFPWWQNSKF